MVVGEKLNNVMDREDININILESLTRKNVYNDLITGNASEKDIHNVADVLGCKVSDIDDTINDEQSLTDETKAIIAIDVLDKLTKMGFSITSFCEWCGLSLSSYNRYVTTKTENTVMSKTANKISFGLNCSIEYLYGFTDIMGRAKYRPDWKSNKYCTKIKPLKDIVNGGSLSPNKLAKLVNLPYDIIKVLMTAGGYMPNSSFKKFCKHYKIDGSSVIKRTYTIKSKPENTSTKNNNVALNKPAVKNNSIINYDTDLMAGYKKQKEVEKMMKESAQATSDHTYDYKHDLEVKVAKLSSPTDGKISLNQLGAAVSILSQRPELLFTFVDMCKLNDNDFSHIYENLVWEISKCNNNGDDK